MKTEKEKNETEILSAEDEKLRVMCRSLKAVHAPRDFEFKVKARLAATKAGDFQPRFGFAFRFALPALALILVLGLVVYNGGIFSSSENSPIVVNNEKTPLNQPLPQNTTVSNLTPPENKEEPKDDLANSSANRNIPKIIESEVAKTTPKRSEAEKKSQLKHDNSIDSVDKSKGIAVIIEPQGLKQNNEKANPIPIKEVLSMTGINADVENGKWTVKTVGANSLAENSGIQPNDLIEAVDEQAISAETTFNKALNVKTMTISRGGEKKVIKLKNK